MDDSMKKDETLSSDLSKNAEGKDSLVLPEHVTIQQVSEATPKLVTECDTFTDEFINYADAELNVSRVEPNHRAKLTIHNQTFSRYYEEPKDLVNSLAHVVCGHCGAEGDHKSSACPVLVVSSQVGSTSIFIKFYSFASV